MCFYVHDLYIKNYQTQNAENTSKPVIQDMFYYTVQSSTFYIYIYKNKIKITTFTHDSIKALMVTVWQRGTNGQQLAFVFGVTIWQNALFSDTVFTSRKLLKTRYLDRYTEVKTALHNDRRLSHTWYLHYRKTALLNIIFFTLDILRCCWCRLRSV